MHQRDLLKEQIEQLGRVLAKVLADFIGWKNQGDVSIAIQQVQQVVQEELDIDLSELVQFDEDAFLDWIKGRGHLQEKALEHLGYLCFEIGKSRHSATGPKKPYLEKALLLLQYVQTNSTTYCLERQMDIEAIKQLL